MGCNRIWQSHSWIEDAPVKFWQDFKAAKNIMWNLTTEVASLGAIMGRAFLVPLIISCNNKYKYKYVYIYIYIKDIVPLNKLPTCSWCVFYPLKSETNRFRKDGQSPGSSAIVPCHWGWTSTPCSRSWRWPAPTTPWRSAIRWTVLGKKQRGERGMGRKWP